MSAFVVDDKTINNFVTWMVRYANHRVCDVNYVAKTSWPKLNQLGFNADEPEKLGTAMHILNVSAVRSRYEDADKSGMVATAYRYQPVTAKPIQIYKSMQCWLYQCSEGNIPDNSKLFNCLEEIKNNLAESIVADLPEYDKATWGQFT